MVTMLYIADIGCLDIQKSDVLEPHCVRSKGQFLGVKWYILFQTNKKIS